MIELIVAIDNKGGMGLNGKLPWYIKKELSIFKEKTQGKTVVVGRKTLLSLPNLPGRDIICFTRNENSGFPNTISDPKELEGDYIVIGGLETYKFFLKQNLIDRVHISIIKNEYTSDTIFNLHLLNGFYITESLYDEEFAHFVMDKIDHGEWEYLNLLREVISNGNLREGRNGNTISMFRKDFKFDLRKGFPLLTTKSMFFRGIVEEFLFFINGETDTTLLENKNIKIWKGNTNKEFLEKSGLEYSPGVMGPMYGYQWRHYNRPYELDEYHKPVKGKGGIDQLKNVVDLILNDHHSRRILMTSYNPSQAKEGVLYPCHSIILQFYVEGDHLDMFCYNRSQDIGLGVPFNIASSALLLELVAKITQKTPRYFHMGMGDVHIYENHVDALKRQIERLPFNFPQLELPNIQDLEEIQSLTFSDFKLLNYHNHGPISMKMVA